MAETRQSNGSRERTRQRAAPEEPSLFRAAPVLARLAASGWWRATGWTVQTSLQAGVRRLDRVHAYLDNLSRLGLIWFSREALEDVRRYQVLEAQPEVAKAMESAGRARTVRRSIHLTAFGEDFCKAALPLDTGEIDALPRQAPEATDPDVPRPQSET